MVSFCALKLSIFILATILQTVVRLSDDSNF